jgi:hypothetical protein
MATDRQGRPMGGLFFCDRVRLAPNLFRDVTAARGLQGLTVAK